MTRKKLSVGIDDFQKLRREKFYYIDKTGLIRDLLKNWGQSQSVHSSASFWEDIEHEYVEELLRDWNG